MTWPPRVKVRRSTARRRKRAALNEESSGEAGTTKAEAANGGASATSLSVPIYACHYCGRANGARTRDHRIPKIYGGSGLIDNIVPCCRMCSVIKSARHYGKFVLMFGLFLEEHGEEYRSCNPDEGKAIRTMGRKFNAWLHALQHAPGLLEAEVEDVLNA